jgi:hypothetical protein
MFLGGSHPFCWNLEEFLVRRTNLVSAFWVDFLCEISAMSGFILPYIQFCALRQLNVCVHGSNSNSIHLGVFAVQLNLMISTKLFSKFELSE